MTTRLQLTDGRAEVQTITHTLLVAAARIYVTTPTARTTSAALSRSRYRGREMLSRHMGSEVRHAAAAYDPLPTVAKSAGVRSLAEIHSCSCPTGAESRAR